MKIKQIKLSKMDIFCYAVLDTATKTCALVDPAFDTPKVLKTLSDEGYRVTHLINTHGHADHTSGNANVLARTEARLYIHRDDAAKLSATLNKFFSFFLGGKGSPHADVLLEDGDEITIGNTTLHVLHTPGHTKGSICLYGDGHVITGDTLFAGAVGRTDLPGGSFTELTRSIHRKIYTLPDQTVVWPGHDYGPTPFSSVGHEKRTNPFTG